MKLKEMYLCSALDRFKEMISNDECSKADIDYFCGLSKYELERRGASVDKKHWLTKEESCRELGLSSSTFDRMVRKGTLSRGKKVYGKKSLLWKREQIEQLKEKMLVKVRY